MCSPGGGARPARLFTLTPPPGRCCAGRENGGNCDIKNLTKGCKIYFPVFVEGANLSMGDIHFSQGDGEVSFCGAIEMSGYLLLK
jgi:formamidase